MFWQKTLLTAILGVLLLVPLLAFTPKPDFFYYEIRRLISGSDDAKYPYSQNLLQEDLHRDVMQEENLSHVNINVFPNEKVYPTIKDDFLIFTQDSVSLLTNEGTRSLLSRPSSQTLALVLPSGVYAEGSKGYAEALIQIRTLTGELEYFESRVPQQKTLNADARIVGQNHLKGPICMPVPVAAKPQFIQLTERDILKTVPLDAQTAALTLPDRALKYSSHVFSQASKYGLSPSLIFAIMHVESAFNPKAVSGKNAHGLMQIVLPTAGHDVQKYFGKTEVLKGEYLLNPEVNIRYGSAYLHLLNTRHLQDVLDPLSREYCVIAAYNGGSARVLRVFGSKGDAVDNINALSAQEVYEKLVTSFPSPETRNFVKAVVNAKNLYYAGK